MNTVFLDNVQGTVPKNPVKDTKMIIRFHWPPVKSSKPFFAFHTYSILSRL